MPGAISGLRDYVSIPVVTSNDFSNPDKIGRAVTKGGEFADNGMEAVGVCMSNVGSGQVMEVGIWGLLLYRPIGVMSSNSRLTITTSGFFLLAAVDTHTVGTGLSTDGFTTFADVNSNALGVAFLSFANKGYIYPLSSAQLFGA